MPEPSPESIVKEIARAIATAGDFCGDERVAAFQVFQDAGCDFDPKLVAQGLALANKRWRKSQSEAMAKVLSRSEWARACADFEPESGSPKTNARPFFAPGD